MNALHEHFRQCGDYRPHGIRERTSPGSNCSMAFDHGHTPLVLPLHPRVPDS